MLRLRLSRRTPTRHLPIRHLPNRIWPTFLSAPLAIGLLVLLPTAARAQVTVEFFGGTAANLHTPLRFEQDGEPPITLTARYSVRPLEDYYYYAARVGFWRNDTGWIVELLHHKLYLENPPPEVQHFEVTHGYNIVSINRGWRRGSTVFLVGGGPVVPHTNSVVRGKERSIRAPYTLAGVAGQVAASRRLNFTPWLFGSVEGKITAAWARVPIADGHATVPNVAFHALAGLGVEF